jgi:hypothetical protein
MKKYIAELWQDNIRVAEIDCPTQTEADREIGHYALMYAQDGPVLIKKKY